jgi:2-C-methyl-D-erythritol 2,4-cyclodiphosphate synthase
MTFRVGFGFDVHKLEEGRALILGGVKIPYHKGTIAHSDGDVLLHAICDSLLGAAALGDIGMHFPDTDINYKGISSLVLLKKVNELLIKYGYRIENIDSTVVLQNPKISHFIEEMRGKISEMLHLEKDKISIKATTTEHIGFEGREEGLSAYAVAGIFKNC